MTFIEPGGSEQVVEAEPGLTLMEAAVDNAIAGIDAECGGACMCATCQVHVAEEWSDRLPEKSEDEISMLEFAVELTPHSRLGCQIPLTDDLDGLVVRVAER